MSRHCRAYTVSRRVKRVGTTGVGHRTNQEFCPVGHFAVIGVKYYSSDLKSLQLLNWIKYVEQLIVGEMFINTPPYLNLETQVLP